MTTIPETTRALIARAGEDKKYTLDFEDIAISELPEGDVLVKIEYTGLNYKDALAITAKAPIIRSFPMVLGIDLAGVVVDSKSDKFSVGETVLVNGFGLSETRWGGYSQYQSLPENMVTKCPGGLSSEQAMQIGTAGYTAALCVLALLEHNLKAGEDQILVTGATGGVSSIAISLLSKLGFEVIGVTSRPEHSDFIKSLGAKDVISRDDMDTGGRALAKERWAGSVDVVGGETLAQLIAQTKYNGIVTCCGMAGGGDLPATVFPFILRGVTLRGVDSVMVAQERRAQAWELLDKHLDRDLLARLSETFEFEDLAEKAEGLINRKITGRVAIRVAHG